MSAELKSGFATFKPRARLLKLIGSELISDEVVAVTELVKNAHDADASRVTISFQGVTAEGGTIVVTDDGCGMDRETLLGGWMEPAGSTKRGLARKVTPKGRWLLGEKGLGRFAADKLGRRLELMSRKTGTASEVCATFDWDAFDDESAMLGDVTSQWEIRPAKEIAKQGTALRITGLREVWTERTFRRLSTRLSRLKSPFLERDDFTIAIESDEFPQYAGELHTDFLDKSPYRIEASFDGAETLSVRLNGGEAVTHRWNGSQLGCGPVRVRIFGFDLETEAVARIGPRMEVRAWLKEWCGISIYRDGFRVWPYGEPHDDWLRLDQRRVNNPVLRLSNNQVVGFVEITQQANPELRDQTNREGLIHNEALNDLRRLMHFALGVLEGERQTVRHPVEKKASTGRHEALQRSQVEEPIVTELRELSAAAEGKLAIRLRGAANRLAEEFARKSSDQDRLIAGYSDLAGLGQAMATLTVEAGEVFERIQSSTAQIRKHLVGITPATGPLLGLEESIRWLDSRVSMMDALRSASGVRRRAVDIRAELRTFKVLFGPLVDAQRGSLEIAWKTSGLLRVDMGPENLRLVLHTLLTNSLQWTAKGVHPRIEVVVSADPTHCTMLFRDNGEGIPERALEKVFEPLFTLREGGRGMGLAIARNLIAKHGGSLRAVGDGRRRGATIEIRLPRKRSRATRSPGA